MVGCWHGYLSGARCRRSYSPADATVSCFSKIQIGFTFLVPAHPGSPVQTAIIRVCHCCCYTWTLIVCFCASSLSHSDFASMLLSLSVSCLLCLLPKQYFVLCTVNVLPSQVLLLLFLCNNDTLSVRSRLGGKIFEFLLTTIGIYQLKFVYNTGN